MESIYTNMPLDPAKKEFRLLTILPTTETAAPIKCTMNVFSLSDFTLRYDEFYSGQTSKSIAHGDVDLMKTWSSLGDIPLKTASIPEKIPKFPDSRQHRFRWGDFATLSYTWGDPRITEKIVVNEVEMLVTTNLASALTVMRDTTRFGDEFRLWADALCIDQNNIEEKNHQVATMRMFYSMSWSVVAFLSLEADDSHKAIMLVETLSEYYGCQEKCRILKDLVLDTKFCEQGAWLALNHLVIRPYWERLWIIQEIALGARRTLLFCGSRSIDWERFCHGLEVIHRYLWLAKDVCVVRDRRALNATDVRVWVESGPLHHISKDLWVLSQSNAINGDCISLSRLLEIGNFSTSFDTRDKVYGLLGVMPSKLAAMLIPDYTLPMHTIFTQLAVAYIQLYSNLEILRDANSWGSALLPTWVPDWTWSDRHRDSRPGTQWQVQAEYQQGEKQNALSEYQSDKGLKFTSPRFEEIYITVQAVLFDEIDGMGTMAAPFQIELVQSNGRATILMDLERMSNQLARALVADRSSASSAAQAILHLPLTSSAAAGAFRDPGWERFMEEVPYYYKWTDWIDANAALIVGGRPLISYFTGAIGQDASFFDHWADYQSWMRTTLGRRFATTSKGSLSWVPFNYNVLGGEQAQQGDILAIFPGCSTPIVLRESDEGFRVIGEAFVLGMMEGEIEGLIQSGVHQMQSIRLY